MSYILDALRKAERDRNMAESPTIQFAAVGDEAPKRSWLLWTLVAVLGIAVGVLGAMQLSQMYMSQEPVASQTKAAPRAEVPVTSTAAPEPQQIAVVTEPEPYVEAEPETHPIDREPVQVHTPSGPVEVDMPVAKPRRPEPKQTPKPTPNPVVQPEPEPVVIDEPAPGPEPEPEYTGDDLPRTELKLPSPAELAREYEQGESAEPASQTAAQPAAANEPETYQDEPVAEVEEESLPSYYGLSAATRNSIGELAMNAHVYSSTPGRGFVMINGSRYREGDNLNEGPLLEQIRKDGIVLDYRGERFILPVGR